jgi:proline iminopeptidase
MREFYPEIEPFNTGMLKVDDLHTISYEEVGNPGGRPIVFIHGGPGGGVDPDHRRFFDPTVWRIILFDQRGCGQSTPFSELRENTTWDLVADLEKLLGLDPEE